MRSRLRTMVFKRRSKEVKKDRRLLFITIVFFIFSFLITLRLFDVQVLQHGAYQAMAQGQQAISEKLLPTRGEIFVKENYTSDQLFPLVTNRELNLVFAIPKQINDSKETVDKLAEVIEINKDEVMMRMEKKEDLYEPIKNQVTDEEADKIKALNLKGIDFAPESLRYYPEGNIGSHLLGFVGYKGDNRVGQYGLEESFDEALRGKVGLLKADRDAVGRWITVGQQSIEEAKDGDSLVLTIDHTIQFYACDQLNKAVLKHGADGGSLIIANPKTGAILAICGSPDYDPNKYSETKNVNTFINPAISYTYEPGSIFKPITMAAALDLGKLSPNTTYEDSGAVTIGKYTIKNSDGKAHGTQTMTQVLEESLNTGAIFAMRQIGPENFYNYVNNFGFGEKTGIELVGEASGNISSLGTYKEIYAATGSFGQGISVTPIQILMAFQAIANKGKMMKPYVIDEVIKPNGFKEKTEPKMLRQVIAPQTATTLGAMLVNVVKNGHGQRAGVPGYFVAGKTGTAQIPLGDRAGYDPNRTIGSFAGFAPVDDPVFVMLAKIDVPRDVQWAESSAAPLFGDIAKFILNYYHIIPERGE